ncbi:hypothetical protein [Enterobacter kobei]|uniref:hypothetical protein n=1 Tax=Enterobacter kobei TaxID=208224 RepID=UPI0038903F7F
MRAAIQMMLPEVEEMLSLGVSREEVFKAVSERFGLENVNVRSFDTALYRAVQNQAKHTALILYCTIQNQPEPVSNRRNLYCTIQKKPRSLSR